MAIIAIIIIFNSSFYEINVFCALVKIQNLKPHVGTVLRLTQSKYKFKVKGIHGMATMVPEIVHLIYPY